VIFLKPIRLIMTAFGPYGDVEEIDFTKLQDRNIFLITGPTGAGKTTIFDAISYGIYGEASGEGRDGESLRSQFAKDDVMTSVEIYFELRGRKYYIKRIPKQMKPKSRGSGFTEQKTDAEMKIFDENGNYKIVCGVSAVNKKVDDIMGINYQQFKQIMMIPQGEFRKLLVSDSKEKEKILRKIFNTEIYSKFQDKLYKMKESILDDIKTVKSKELENINKIQCSEDSLLYEEMEKDDKNFDKILRLLEEQNKLDSVNMKKIKDEILKVSLKIENLSKKTYEAEENNKKISEKIKLEAVLDSLKNKEKVISSKENRLLKGRKALKVESFEKDYIDRKEDIETKRKQLAKSILDMKNIKNKLKEAEEALKCEESKKDYINKIVEKIAELKSYRDNAIKLKKKNKELQLSEDKFNKLKNNLENKKNYIKLLKEEIDKLKNSVENSDDFKDKEMNLQSKCEKLDRVYEVLLNLNEENNKIVDIRKDYIKLRNKMNKDRELLEKAKEELEHMEKMSMEGQAAFLAASLIEGKPCPVCGSVHHPHIAEMKDVYPDKNKIENHKKRVKKIEDNYEKSRENFQRVEVKGNTGKQIISKIKKDYENLTGENIDKLEKLELTMFIKNNIDSLKLDIEKVKSEILKIKAKQESIEKKKNKLKEKTLVYERENAAFEKINEEYSNQVAEVERIRGIVNGITEGIPSEFRSIENLQSKIDEMELTRNKMENSIKVAQNNYINSRSMYERICSNKESIEKDIKNMELRLEKIKRIFEESVLSFGFINIEDYRNCKISEKEEIKLEKDINRYYTELKSTEDRYRELSFEVKDLTPVDIGKLKSEINRMKEDKNKLDKEKSELDTRININEAAFRRLTSLLNDVKEKEKKYSVVGELAVVSRGKNYERINFETYVLASFFEDIIEAANIRFQKMSEGRYELSRITELGKGRAQTGLDLQVYDNYTGKYRHVKTLSGGESFKAALSLSLGLADIVQCYSGGINLDTMFIDEGFGTLDSESLDNAIQCLIELQSEGRLVGIISHVPELKDRIDAKLEIIPSTEGSRTQFNIV
jgi:DNA repair protein SbcC/Rad50